MRGLIQKDMYCLRKNLRMFFCVTLGIIFLSVLFCLSSRYGNIAKGIEEMKAQSPMGEEVFYSFFQAAVWVTLFIPIAFVSMIVECFKEDRKAGFWKCMFSLPLSDRQIVGSRYLSCMLFALVGVCGSLLAGIAVSLTSQVFAFEKLCSYVLTFCAVLLIYMSIVMFLLYLLGVEKADLIQCIPFLAVFLIAMVVVANKIFSMPEESLDAMAITLFRKLADCLSGYSMAFFCVALVCMALSYFGACQVIKKRKGCL